MKVNSMVKKIVVDDSASTPQAPTDADAPVEELKAAEPTPVVALAPITVAVQAPPLTKVRVKIGSLMFEKGLFCKGETVEVTDEEYGRMALYVEIIK
jgi:hypothetical protein